MLSPHSVPPLTRGRNQPSLYSTTRQGNTHVGSDRHVAGLLTAACYLSFTSRYLQWLGITLAMLFLSWIIANAIPFFHLLMGLVAACTTAPLTFGFPALFYYWSVTKAAGGGDAGDMQDSLLSQEMRRSVGGDGGDGGGDDMHDAPPKACHGQNAHRGRRVVLPLWEKGALLLMVLLTIFLFCLGLISNMEELVDKWGSTSQPFSCRALQTAAGRENTTTSTCAMTNA